jgi:hypothetical protein
VLDSGAGEGCDRSAVGGASDGCVVKSGVGVDGEIAGWEHPKVWVDGVKVEGDEGVRQWGRFGVG